MEIDNRRGTERDRRKNSRLTCRRQWRAPPSLIHEESWPVSAASIISMGAFLPRADAVGESPRETRSYKSPRRRKILLGFREDPRV